MLQGLIFQHQELIDNICYLSAIKVKINNNLYGPDIISLIPSPLVGEG